MSCRILGSRVSWVEVGPTKTYAAFPTSSHLARSGWCPLRRHLCVHRAAARVPQQRPNARGCPCRPARRLRPRAGRCSFGSRVATERHSRCVEGGCHIHTTLMPFILWRRQARDKPIHISRQPLTHFVFAPSIMRRIWCRPEAYQRLALQRVHRRGRHDRRHARRVHRQP